MVEQPVNYWAQVGAELGTHRPNRWWRAYCDGLNRRWLNQALAGRRCRRALKTDLFDEAAGGGIRPPSVDHLIGIDLAASTARLAMQQRDLQAVAADVKRLPFCDGAFDLVVSLSTLDHFLSVAEISHAVREIRRVLAVGGMLALTLDNLSSPYIRLRNSLPWPLLFRSRLVPYFIGVTMTRGQLQEVLTASGFRVLQCAAVMHTPRLLTVPLVEHIGGPLLLRVLEGLELFGRLPTR